MAKIYYQEDQKFDRIFLFLIVFSAIMSLGIVLAAALADNGESNKELVWVIPILLVSLGVPIWLILKMRMEIKIDETGIYMKYFPFRRKWKHYSFEKMTSSPEVIKGSLLTDFGGWGYGKGIGKKRSYTTKGDHGVRFEYSEKRDRIIFIGTQKPKLLEAALKNALNHGKTEA